MNDSLQYMSFVNLKQVLFACFITKCTLMRYKPMISEKEMTLSLYHIARENMHINASTLTSHYTRPQQ